MSYDEVPLLLNEEVVIERSPDHWWVTTAVLAPPEKPTYIERSPDHWWVTTLNLMLLKYWMILKGHQIIGELRHCSISFVMTRLIERSPDHWWVTTVGLVVVVTVAVLKGHQIIGELRPSIRFVRVSTIHWKVTRSLVSYDLMLNDCIPVFKLKGHQIIGELRPQSMRLYCLPT